VKHSNFTINSWRTLLITLALVLAALTTWATSYFERGSLPESTGTLGVSFGAPDRDYRVPIHSLSPMSPLAQLGARPGDLAVFDHPNDLIRTLGTDEMIGGILYSTKGSSHFLVRPIPDPDSARHPMAALVGVGTWGATAYISLLFGVLIGLRRADSNVMRLFSLALLAVSGDYFMYNLPSGATLDLLGRVVDPLRLMVKYLFIVYFSLSFPEERPHMQLTWVRRMYYVFAAAFIFSTAYAIADNYHLVEWSLRQIISSATFSTLVKSASTLISIIALWLSWRRSTGETKRRLAWIGVCIGAISFGYLSYNLNQLFGQPMPETLRGAAQGAIVMLAYLGLGYATLRHRLFDLGFARNRVLVVTIISSFLLVVFSITEWGVDKLLHFEGREKNVIFDAAVALAVILSFHRIQHWVSHQVDHFFFHHWHEAAQKLKHFQRNAPFITDIGVLQNRFIGTIETYAQARGAAIYTLDPSQAYRLQAATLSGGPTLLDANDETVVELRQSHAVLSLCERGDLPGVELALPMVVRGRLEGMVLIGKKADERQYRPDEIALLETAAHQLGMDLAGLHSEQLAQRAAMAEEKALLHERETKMLRQVLDDTLKAKAVAS